MQYMAPGSHIEDLLDDDDDDDDDAYFIPMATPNVLAGSGPSVLTALVRSTNPSAQQPNAQSAATAMSKMQPQQHIVQKSVTSKIKLSRHGGGDDGGDDLDWGLSGAGGGATGARAMNHKVLNELRGATETSAGKSKDTDRSERATVENVMDPRTRMILYKLVNSGFLQEINGCVSTGKEANVYYAVSGDGTPAALKVYKTSILVFKDRDKYVAGEFRFQRYCKSNPRKMVRTWAEKEARNLTRLANCGVLAPKVKLLRQHVLVMEFIGEDGWPAPRLKEVTFSSHEALDRCYLDLIVMMRIMFTQCRLVHGDLSEYNLLFDNGKIVMIDVSQSVEHDHPQSMAFLRRDIVNVNSFFRTKGHSELFSLQRLFQFITAPSLAVVAPQQQGNVPSGVPSASGGEATSAASNVASQIAAAGASQFSATETPKMMMKKLLELRAEDEAAKELAGDNFARGSAEVEEQVFLSINMPRNLDEISDSKRPNAEIAPFVDAMLARNGPSDASKTGGKKNRDSQNKKSDAKDNRGHRSKNDDGDDDNPSPKNLQKTAAEVEPESSSADDEENEEEEEDEEDDPTDATEPRPLVQLMTKEERKENKKAVKQANRERREHKMPKADKRRATRRVKHK